MTRNHVTCAMRVALLATLTVATATADIIHESARMGPNNQFGGTGVSTTSFIGSRFAIAEPTQVTAVGGHLGGVFSHADLIFGAIVALDGPSAFPHGTASPMVEPEHALAPDEVVATATFDTLFTPSQDWRFPLETVLQPGDYALVFGSGLFGASGGGFMPLNNPPLPGSSFIYWHDQNEEWRESLFGLYAYRHVVEGYIIPEPARIWLVGPLASLLRRR